MRPFSMACVRCKLLINNVYSRFIDKSFSVSFRTLALTYQRKRDAHNLEEQNVKEEEITDFYGVMTNDNSDALTKSGPESTCLSASDLKRKYANYTSDQRQSECIVEVPFGHIRYDNANKAKVDGTWNDWSSVKNDSSVTLAAKDNSRRRLRRLTTENETFNKNTENTNTTITPQFLQELPQSVVTNEQYFGLIYDIKAMGLEDNIPKYSQSAETNYKANGTYHSNFFEKQDHEESERKSSRKFNIMETGEFMQPGATSSSSTEMHGVDENQISDLSPNAENFIEDQYFSDSLPSSEVKNHAPEFSNSVQNNYQTLENQSLFAGEFERFSDNVRYDTSRSVRGTSDNRRLHHKKEDCDHEKSYNFIDEQYFGDSESIIKEDRDSNVEGCGGKNSQRVTEKKDHAHTDDANFIEDQYFGNASNINIQNNHSNFQEENILSLSDSYSSVLLQTENTNNTMFDGTGIGKVAISGSDQEHSIEESSEKAPKCDTEQERKHVLIDGQRRKTLNTSDTTESTPTSFSYDFSFSENPQVSEKENLESRQQSINQEDGEKKRTAYVNQEDREKKRTAYEYVKSVRETKETNPRMVGANRIKSFIPDIDKMTKGELVDLLHEQVIYNKDDIVAINKPYGLPSKPGPNVRVSVAHLLGSLAERLHHDNLYLVHRLDKETTGVMLLAKSMKTHHRLQDAFIHQEVIKKYVTITKGLPKPEEGIIDIPIGEGQVQSKVRMKLLPRIRPDGRPLGKLPDGHKAVTRYRVMSSSHNAALIECQPATGVKHQIRVHLAFGLNTPILGDHKYSHMDRIAPQKLHGDFLNRLDIPQTKVRYIPMHLHASSLTIPHFLDGRNLYIACQMSPLLKYSMKKLKLTKLKGVNS